MMSLESLTDAQQHFRGSRFLACAIVGLALSQAIGCGQKALAQEVAASIESASADDSEFFIPADNNQKPEQIEQEKQDPVTPPRPESRVPQTGVGGQRPNPAQTGGNAATAGAPEAISFDAVKTRIQATDEEWKVIGPKLRKLMVARRATELSAGNTQPGGMGGGRGGRGGPGGNDSFGGPSNSSGGFGGPGFGGPGGFGGPDDFGPGGPGGAGSRNGPPTEGDQRAGNRAGTDRSGATPPAGNPNPGPGATPPAGRAGMANQNPGGPNQFIMGGPPPGFGGMGGPGGGDAAITKAIADLQTAVADTKSTPEVLKEKVAAVRLARHKAKEKLELARKDLLELLTLDQEAILITLGYLD
ncbi:hypothetical protein BH10PLA2_BH10PLA2_14040 [soil metagenome]